jgi:uncharacterized protein (DUF1501 family)
MSSRRTFLKSAAASLVVASSGISWARAETDRRLVVMLLRGGLDGLSLLPPHGDPSYARARRTLAIAPPGSGEGAALPASDLLGIHPAMPTVGALWQAGEATLVHAAGYIGAKRSHFEAQDQLEGGGAQPRTLRTGWLSRALHTLDTSRPAAAVGRGMPLLLRGDAPATVVDPGMQVEEQDELMARLAMLYASDPGLRAALEQSAQTTALLEELPEEERSRRRNRRSLQLRAVGSAASKVLSEPDGARVAVIDTTGWDTHAGQRGSLQNRLGALDDGIDGLRSGLGALWSKTAVLVVTEFGRTVEQNGTGGTDHGTGGAALLLGGAVRGRVITDWPGLAMSDRLDGRDLRPTTDLRALFKGVLLEHLNVPEAAMGNVFPGADDIAPLQGLVRV